MPPDRLLNTVLQYYQDVHDAAKTDQIIGTTTHLLVELSNPLNLGVLTSQLLTAPAIWHQPGGAKNATRVIAIYNTAAVRVHNNETAAAEHFGPPEGGGLRCEEWTRAVVKGADDRSKRWHHLLVLTGVLMGMEGNERRSLSRNLRNTLEHAVVTAANLALQTQLQDGPIAGVSIVTALTFAFPLISDFHKSLIDCDALLPLAVWAVTADEGFCDGQILESIGAQITESPSHQLAWSPKTPSFHLLQELDRRPLIANLGPLSRLAGFAIQQATDTRVVMQAQDSLVLFSGRVLDAWRNNKFNDVDPALEAAALSPETLRNTWPVLWAFLKKIMFATVAILQAVVSRSLLDPLMLNNATAPGVATKSLHILRNIYFISARNGNNAFQVYSFTNLASIDSLSQSAAASQMFLQETRPFDTGLVGTTYLQRTLDLFYLNMAEHLPLALATDVCDSLIIKPATVYISHNGPMTPSIVELFESAHSAVLSVLSCPQHSRLTIQLAPFYIVKLFESFPQHISARQFRVAFKTVMQVVSPPFPIAELEPQLSETLLEMLRSYAATASTEPLPATPDAASQAASGLEEEEPLSQQSALAFGLVDSLPFLPPPLLQDWLTITAEVVNGIADPNFRGPVKKRFIGILVSGELDVQRAAIGVAWWGTQGGREMLLLRRDEPPMMSGALGGPETLSRL